MGARWRTTKRSPSVPPPALGHKPPARLIDAWDPLLEAQVHNGSIPGGEQRQGESETRYHANGGTSIRGSEQKRDVAGRMAGLKDRDGRAGRCTQGAHHGHPGGRQQGWRISAQDDARLQPHWRRVTGVFVARFLVLTRRRWMLPADMGQKAPTAQRRQRGADQTQSQEEGSEG